MVKRGVPPAAAQAAVGRLAEFIRNQQLVIVEMQAVQEAKAGVIGPAVQALAEPRARNAQHTRAKLGAGGGMRQSLLPRPETAFRRNPLRRMSHTPGY
jgi:hypothetical protein